jgi:tetratricopeptide (TPR) repeat protein
MPFHYVHSYVCRPSLSTEDCYQIGKQLNSAQMYKKAIVWLKQALKSYNEYYDLHQVRKIEILQELAISFLNSNQMHYANDIISKILRMDSNNQIVSYIKRERRRRGRSTLSDLCHPVDELLNLITYTCPI